MYPDLQDKGGGVRWGKAWHTYIGPLISVSYTVLRGPFPYLPVVCKLVH